MNEKNVVNGEELVVESKDAIIVPSVEAEVSDTNTEQVPLSAASLQYYDEATKKEILRVANEVDVTQFEKVIAYGSIPVLRTFDLAGKVLKEAAGTSADQEVVEMVAELAKQAQDKYNLVIQEPNFLEKFVIKIMSGFKSDSADKKVKAVSCFKVLEQYVKSCDKWLENLKKSHDAIMLSGQSKIDACYELEQYIVAGCIAEERISEELDAAKQEWEQTGMVESKKRYDELKEGLDMFRVVIQNLEKSRAARGLAASELALELHANRRIQLAVDSQKTHSSTVMAEQLEVALYDAINKEALEGQKAIAEINNRLMEVVAQRIKSTGEAAERILVDGVYTPEAAQRAAETVISAYNSIKAANDESRERISANMEKLKATINELSPYVEKLKNSSVSETTEVKVSTSSQRSGLVF